MNNCKEISVKAIIFIDGKLLMLFRKRSPILPGGRVEKGETLEEALLRELEEELGITKNYFEIKCPITSITYKSKIYIYYLVELADKSLIDKIKLSKEHDSWELLDMNKIDKIGWLRNMFSKLNFKRES